MSIQWVTYAKPGGWHLKPYDYSTLSVDTTARLASPFCIGVKCAINKRANAALTVVAMKKIF